MMVLRERIELSTSPLPRECSTTELPQPMRRTSAISFRAAQVAIVVQKPAIDRPQSRSLMASEEGNHERPEIRRRGQGRPQGAACRAIARQSPETQGADARAAPWRRRYAARGDF